IGLEADTVFRDGCPTCSDMAWVDKDRIKHQPARLDAGGRCLFCVAIALSLACGLRQSFDPGGDPAWSSSEEMESDSKDPSEDESENDDGEVSSENESESNSTSEDPSKTGSSDDDHDDTTDVSSSSED